VIVVGSQAILGTYEESQLAAAATMSDRGGLLSIADTNAATARLADLIEGVAGEFSSSEGLHGFSIDSADLDTAAVPEDGVTACCRFKTPIQPQQPDRLDSPAGASTSKTSASRS